MAFSFDPHAELARIENRTCRLATAATVATDPAMSAERHLGNAFVAEVATVAGGGDADQKAACDRGIRDQVEEWARRLRECRNPSKQDALKNWHWIEIAARRGWDEPALFGLWTGLIVRLKAGVIKDLYPSYVATETGVILMRSSREDQPLIWAPGAVTTEGEQDGPV